MIAITRLQVPLLLAAISASACRQTTVDPGPWVDTPPARVVSVADLDDRALRETSGVAASRRFPGLLWSHNDSGHPAELVSTDTTGSILGVWELPGASNVDWEDLALGPCPAGTCLYVGDVGDNNERRTSISIYRVPEPDPGQVAAPLPEPSTLRVHLPDRPRDIEALHVDTDSTVWLVSKGRTGSIILYRILAAEWGRDSVVAEWVDSLPIPHYLPTGHLVTGSAVSPSGDRVVVRTYHDLFLFARYADGRMQPASPPNRCSLEGLEVQGEAVDWWDDSTLVVTSEARDGVAAKVRLIDCGWRPIP